MHVAMMLYEGFRLLDVTGPMDVFHEANRLCGGVCYEQHLLGPSAEPVVCSNGVAVGTTACRRDTCLSFDIVVMPGSSISHAGCEPRELMDWLNDVGRTVRRLVSVSNGFLLIERAGLADHRTLTGHWHDMQGRAVEFSSVHGVIDGIQTALALVREDLGNEFARSIAKSLSRHHT